MPRLDGCPCGDYKANRTAAGNCRVSLASDGLPVQCVDWWAGDKHDYLSRYIEATRAVRARYIEPVGQGGAAFIDLFSGPGVACVRSTGQVIPGSPLIALRHAAAPFSRLVFCDLDPENIRALAARTVNDRERISVVPGDSNENIAAVVAQVPEYGLNMALVDPYGPRELCWGTMRALAARTRMDFIIHFPTGSLKRNFGKRGFDRRIDAIVGTDAWRAKVRGARDVPRLIGYLRSSLVGLGYASDQVRSLPITNSRNVPIYHLVFATRHERGNAIWQSIARRSPAGQGELGF